MKKTRRYPKRYAEFLVLAKSEGLPNAHGRALYAINAHQNGRFGTFFGVSHSVGDVAILVMCSCQPATAARWAKHYAAGGSLKSLSHGKSGRSRVSRDNVRTKRSFLEEHGSTATTYRPEGE